jgi:hypothetical protein
MPHMMRKGALGALIGWLWFTALFASPFLAVMAVLLGVRRAHDNVDPSLKGSWVDGFHDFNGGWTGPATAGIVFALFVVSTLLQPSHRNRRRLEPRR